MTACMNQECSSQTMLSQLSAPFPWFKVFYGCSAFKFSKTIIIVEFETTGLTLLGWKYAQKVVINFFLLCINPPALPQFIFISFKFYTGLAFWRHAHWESWLVLPFSSHFQLISLCSCSHMSLVREDSSHSVGSFLPAEIQARHLPISPSFSPASVRLLRSVPY